MKIVSVVGARPNFMKIAPVTRAVARYNEEASDSSLGAGAIEHALVHTGQHYDDRMSRAFFSDLGIPEADYNLGVGSGTHAEQVGHTMIEFEKVLRELRPDWVLIVGDVNATCACSITARKEGVRLAHLEAGLRSFDWSMPEEVNRVVADRLSHLLLTPDRFANANLHAEGVAAGRIAMVGNVMIETLLEQREKASVLEVSAILDKHRITPVSRETETELGTPYALVTLHRPSNVDDPLILRGIVEFFSEVVCRESRLLWPIHPRTRSRLEATGIWDDLCRLRNLVLLHPLGYREMLRLSMEAEMLFTDSGGLQEECCALGVPCVTLRENTERPVTLRENGGLSVLAGNDPERIHSAYAEAKAFPREPFFPENWDSKVADRAVEAVLAFDR